ncbi:YbaN family protein [Fusobacterium sp. PH5-44]|uniref:YbaN family protein n=1 Tax=unclassified Fusobacterium TaxID=2648384 RepID=UPI003D24FC09
MKRNILITLGFLCLFFGTWGIFLPVLPTTPFLLLGAYFFSRSSEKWYQFLTTNKVFGKYIDDYMMNKGITLKNKIFAESFLAIGLGFSYYKMRNMNMRYIFPIIFIGVSVHILKLKTLKK